MDALRRAIALGISNIVAEILMLGCAYLANFYILVIAFLIVLPIPGGIALAALTKPMYWAAFLIDIGIAILAGFLVRDTYLIKREKSRAGPTPTPSRPGSAGRLPRQRELKLENLD